MIRIPVINDGFRERRLYLVQDEAGKEGHKKKVKKLSDEKEGEGSPRQPRGWDCAPVCSSRSVALHS